RCRKQPLEPYHPRRRPAGRRSRFAGDPLHPAVANAAMIETVNVPAPGITLAGSLHRDGNVAAAGTVVLINSAMGMPRGFYTPLANFLAGEGIDTLTWDYRGIGDSVKGSVKNTPSSIHDWGEQDLPAMIDWLRARYPQRR